LGLGVRKMGYRRTYRIHESGESKTGPDLNSNPKGHRRPYRIHESGESKTDPNLNSNPNQNTHPNLIPKP